MRSALLDVPGVTRARVTLEEHDAVVTYDSAKVKVADLLEAVSKAQGPMTPNQYTAMVKKPKK